jgi:hypothetical protein
MKENTTMFLDAIFKKCSKIDFAINLSSGGWRHPDHAAGKNLNGCDRARAEYLRGMLFGQNKSGANIFFRPQEHSPFVLLDDLSKQDASNIAEKYSAIIVQTSTEKYQSWIESDKSLSFDERHIIQSYLIEKMNTGLTENFRADKGASGGKQIGRVPGFWNKKTKYAPNFPEVKLISAFQSDMKFKTALILERREEGFCFTPVPRRGSAVASPKSSFGNESSIEFADACRHFEKNLDIETGIQNLAARALSRKKAGINNYEQADRYARSVFKSAALKLAM